MESPFWNCCEGRYPTRMKVAPGIQDPNKKQALLSEISGALGHPKNYGWISSLQLRWFWKTYGWHFEEPMGIRSVFELL